MTIASPVPAPAPMPSVPVAEPAAQGPSWQSVALIVTPIIVTAIVSSITSYFAYASAKDAKAAAQEAVIRTKETHDLVNSRLSEMLPLLKAGAADRATLDEKVAQSGRTAAAEQAAKAAPAAVDPAMVAAIVEALRKSKK